MRPASRVSLVVAAWVGRKSATAAAMTRASARPRNTASRTASRIADGRLRGHDGDPRRDRDLEAAGDQRDPRPASDRGPGDRDAHLAAAAIADEPDGVDRLGGAAGGDDDVATLEVEGAQAVDDRGPGGGAGLADRRVADGFDHRVDDVAELRQPPDAGLAGRQQARLGLDDPVAELAPQALDVDPRRGVRPHVAVHRRRDHDRRRRREAGREHGVVRDPAGHRPQPAGGGRGHDDRVGGVGDDDVPDPLVGEEVEDVGLDGVPGQGLERQRPDEPGRRRREHHDDVGALRGQAAQELDRLVRRDRAADAEPDQPALEAAATAPPSRRSLVIGCRTPAASRPRPRGGGSRGP